MSTQRPIREPVALWLGAGVSVAAALLLPWMAWATAARFDDTVPTVGGPTSWPTRWRDVGWPRSATPWLIGYLTALVALVGVIVWLVVQRQHARRAGIAARTRHLPGDRAGWARYVNGRGPVIGDVVHGSRVGPTLRMTLEDQGLVIAGPRAGKTTMLAIPAALAHRGPMIVTSN